MSGLHDGTFKPGGPRSREKLLRVGTDAGRPGCRKSDIQQAIQATRGATLAAADGIDPSCVDDFAIWLMAVSARGVGIDDIAAEPHQPNVKAKASTRGSRNSIWTWRRLPHADISQEAPDWGTDGGGLLGPLFPQAWSTCFAHLCHPMLHRKAQLVRLLKVEAADLGDL